MQRKILWIGLAFVWASSLPVNAQEAKQDSTYKKYFVGSTFMMLGNFIPNDPNRPDFVQLNVGYRITPEDVVFLELKTSKFNWPLGMPWGEILDEQRQLQYMESKWPKYFGYEPGLHFGVNL